MCLSDLRARKSHELCSNYVNLPRRFWEINLTNDRGSYFSIIDHSEQAMSKSHELTNDLLKVERAWLCLLMDFVQTKSLISTIYLPSHVGYQGQILTFLLGRKVKPRKCTLGVFRFRSC